MIPNEEKMFGIKSLKSLSALLRGKTLKHHGDFYCLNCPCPFATKKQA